MTLPNTVSSVDLARHVRSHVLRMTHRARASHVGSCFSAADILAVLYAGILRVSAEQPDAIDRDRFILSKGHSAAALYATLAECGFFPTDWLERYSQDGAPLGGHVTARGVPGVDLSTGSLGHGLPVACGFALAAKIFRRPTRVVTLISDGECDEGTTWEAALFAPHHRLDNLTVVIDYNKIQSFGRVSEVLDLSPLPDKWQAFGWNVIELDGHDHAALQTAFTGTPAREGHPTVIIAHTIKGKGVSFMEDRLEWHYRSVNAEQLQQALTELGAA